MFLVLLARIVLAGVVALLAMAAVVAWLDPTSRVASVAALVVAGGAGAAVYAAALRALDRVDAPSPPGDRWLSPARSCSVRGPSAGGIRNHVAALADGLLGPRLAVTGRRPRRRAGHPTAAAASTSCTPTGCKGWLASLVPRRTPLVVTVHNVVLDEVAGRAAWWQRRLEAALPKRVDAVIATSPTWPPGSAARCRSWSRPSGRRPPALPIGTAVGALGVRRRHADSSSSSPASTARRASTPARRGAPALAGPGRRRRRGTAGSPLAGADRRRGPGRRRALAGPSADAAAALAAADVVAVPSVWESGPLVVAEAMELGRPVVTTPVGFAPELVDDGVTGRIVPVGDAAALAEAVRADLPRRRRAAARWLPPAGPGRRAGTTATPPSTRSSTSIGPSWTADDPARPLAVAALVGACPGGRAGRGGGDRRRPRRC